jgi:peptidyl-prolyl cis-trans isomerase SurA
MRAVRPSRHTGEHFSTPDRGSPRAAAVLALLWTTFAAQSGGAEDMVIDGIAAQVGSQIVLYSDVTRTAAPIEKRMREAGAPTSQIMMMRAEALERLIEAKIISGVVERTELGAGEEEVSRAIRMIADDAGLTLEQLVASVSSHGMTVEEYRGQIQSEIERSKIVNAMVRSRVHVDHDEVYNLYLERYGDQPEAGGQQVHLRHILVSAGPTQMRSHESACGELETARERIESGEANFDQVARSLSDFKAEVGGDLGWMSPDDLAAWMAPAVNSLEPGQMTSVLSMSFGCNLLMLVDRREYAPTTLEEVYPKLEGELHERKTGEEYAKWVEKLRSETYIERKGVFAETARLEQGAGGPGRRP